MASGSIALVVFMLHVKRRDRGRDWSADVLTGWSASDSLCNQSVFPTRGPSLYKKIHSAKKLLASWPQTLPRKCNCYTFCRLTTLIPTTECSQFMLSILNACSWNFGYMCWNGTELCRPGKTYIANVIFSAYTVTNAIILFILVYRMAYIMHFIYLIVCCHLA